ncbi:hypothetical protein K458DRAFT_404778 [Lentithecium fluviatile CBS 122367]|uniref:Uncharacterized protein n=1 Tax=Lentithecium fluviatile CBS 122367 TaxID=1168545 RepID=A0A6G1J011_9PLEO|nr:hypothetical protein K458DRAFT_404778 [Lentithecium fluviatile CBS 122367]
MPSQRSLRSPRIQRYRPHILPDNGSPVRMPEINDDAKLANAQLNQHGGQARSEGPSTGSIRHNQEPTRIQNRERPARRIVRLRICRDYLAGLHTPPAPVVPPPLLRHNPIHVQTQESGPARTIRDPSAQDVIAEVIADDQQQHILLPARPGNHHFPKPLAAPRQEPSLPQHGLPMTPPPLPPPPALGPHVRAVFQLALSLEPLDPDLLPMLRQTLDTELIQRQQYATNRNSHAGRRVQSGRLQRPGEGY